MLPCNCVIVPVMLIGLTQKPLLLKNLSTNIKGQIRLLLSKVIVRIFKVAVKIGMSNRDGLMSISIEISKISSSKLERMIQEANFEYLSDTIFNIFYAIKMIVLCTCSKVLFKISLRQGES